MTAGFKHAMRVKIITVAAILTVLFIAFVIKRHGQFRDPLREDQIKPSEQFVQHGEEIPEYRRGAAGAYESPSIEDLRPQSQSDEQRKIIQPERYSTIVPINGAFMEARLIHKVDPVYPEIAKSTGLWNRVTLDITIDEKGSVANVRVIDGHTVFTDAAVDAVVQWLYEPVLVDGTPIPVSFGIDVVFSENEDVYAGHKMTEDVEANHVIFASDNLSDMSVRADPFNSNGSPLMFEKRQYHPVTPDISAPVIQADKSRIRDAVQAVVPHDYRIRDLYMDPIYFLIFINENGGIDSIRQDRGKYRSQELEKELQKSIRVQSPATFNGKAIPSYIRLTIDVPDFVR